MDAEDGDVDAAIGLAAAAGDADAAGEIGVDRDPLAGVEGAARGRLDHLTGEFVAHHAGISEERLVAGVDMIIGAAQADAADADQQVARPRLRRIALDRAEVEGLLAHDRQHRASLYLQVRLQI